MDILAPLIVSALVWIVLLIGIVFGGLTLGKHRSVSVLAITGLSGFLLLDVVGTEVWTAYEWLIAAQGGVGAPVYLKNAFFFVQTLLHAFFIGLAIVAATRGRAPRARE